ncbi:DEAD/DEAH box helicase [Nocardia jiangxiensis]|uniref:DEAD/DEAH box helicase n=1 Tax=Nocardia jiangxiensis TaxID=282685 RepID=UPI00030608C8|nr:DEAD/DEAH box helicase [Nocardia jiangxiensis]
MGGEDERRGTIVEFWQAVEMFSPQRVDRPDRQQRVFQVEADELLPWDPAHELARVTLHPNQAWRHIVYVGIYRLDEVFEVLSRRFDPDPDSYDERPGGESAVAAFLIDENGCAVTDSNVLSSCAWATGHAGDDAPGPKWIADFQDASLEFTRLWQKVIIAERTGVPGDDSAQPTLRVFDRTVLDECLTAAIQAAGISGVLPVAGIRVRSQIVARRTANEVNGLDFLNSFIMDDLVRVSGHVTRGNIGAALRDYLCPEDRISTGDRIDVRERIDTVLELTSPAAVAAGRWPSDPGHALALSQQLAVNTALGMTDTGIVGVNGPPGTGKTTMLRDVISALVVERAARLAALPEPGAAFTGDQMRWKTGDRTRVVSLLRPELTGFEIVVASSNNGAVQNVTDEIPASDAIGDDWRDAAAAANYFPEVATALLAPDPAERSSQAIPVARIEGWALLAARLGNKTNRGRFVNAFWYHTPDSAEDQQDWAGLLSILKSYEAEIPEQTWEEAVEAFRAAETRVETIRRSRCAVYTQVVRRREVKQQLETTTADLAAAVASAETTRGERDSALHTASECVREAERLARVQQAADEQAARQRRAVAEQAVHDCRAEVERIVDGRRVRAEESVTRWVAELDRRVETWEEHRAQRPRWWKLLWSFGAAGREWKQRDSALADQVQQASQAIAQAQVEWEAVQCDLAIARSAVSTAQHELTAATRASSAGIPLPSVTYEPLIIANRTLERAEREVTAAAQALSRVERRFQEEREELVALNASLTDGAGLKTYFPDDTWWTERDRRESAAPWTDPEWNTVRSELLLAALALHRSFLQQMPTRMRQNLQAAMDVVGGGAPRDLSVQAAQAAWQSLFLVVPVVSTTFASYGRLFGHLEREALGWLLIDEAGQATPQNAVGALWRTRRAVVVGDPLQLEPVTTLPFRTEDALRTDFGVDPQWSSSHTSVQRIADRLTPLGTSLPDDEVPTWVGVPLTVHRRCDSPMFDIVNTIAYDGLMINGTGTAAREHFDATYPSLPESKWIDVVGASARGHWIPDEGRQLDRILRFLEGLGIAMSEVMVISPFRDTAREIARRARDYPGLTAGTIHTAQGKQADVVILVLGGDPARPGARRWAASKPNLLNVAVSRAKRRLYVIGDHRSWSTERYFGTLARYLPQAEPVWS